ncbi:MAG TPA: alanine--tRNA ligase [Saprospiraceae bacterium]|nr:alanine--tRNA ligase [Saprospiraceae bacterium]HMQ81982.1 alanine--tRNA ligase [Saprospiraceae bacterium]
MMTANEIRQAFLDFFASKQHKIVPSAPIVNKDDPTLMFTNAGMNQFKDYFLGNQPPETPRIADTQKCMRVSGKHNDLEDVGKDGTHHTMFEMLGNWSFGDYFKNEALAWSWELLTGVFGIPKDRLYATVFGGDQSENLDSDEEARQIWLQFLPEDHILYGNKKDNFWEMGDTGPCGPCSEIHVDLRSDEERQSIPGRDLVNQDHPRVVEIWNNVFIQFNRKADGSLEELPAKHVDTGMGFERLCMVLQGKTVTYDTDVFQPVIQYIEKHTGIPYTGIYTNEAKSDIAMRVVADHIRSIAFTIADGQLPSNTGAGYVIRRILRRAVRYYYSFLNINEPFLHTLIPMMADSFSSVFPELKAQKEQIARIIEGEEKTFLNTLERGIKRFESLSVNEGQIKGEDAFELYDTYGFPIDLTRLMASERALTIEEAGYEKALLAQKERSRASAQKTVGDWYVMEESAASTFVGYDQLEVENAQILKYRTVQLKDKEQYQVVLSQTPFYAQSGGQAGDNGLLWVGDEPIPVLDTLKENDLTIHVVQQLPEAPEKPVRALVNAEKRQATSANHSATHLMHAALHRILGDHALQKGQDVDDKRLRFDFSHFQKVTAEELEAIENMVNAKVRANIALEEQRHVPIEEAKASGAMMLFGEKYGENVRIITFDPNFSKELCGGTHVKASGEIGLFKIVSESAVAAGIRRLEAITADRAEAHIKAELEELAQIRALFKNTPNTLKSVTDLQEEVKQLRKEAEQLKAEQAYAMKGQLMKQIQEINGIPVLIARLPLEDANIVKNLANQIENEVGDLVIVFGTVSKDKPQLTVSVSRTLVESKGLHAGNIIRELAKEIQGGGGGQPFFASAGGKDAAGLDKALEKVKSLIML